MARTILVLITCILCGCSGQGYIYARTRSYNWEALYSPGNIYVGNDGELAVEMSAVYSQDRYSRKFQDVSKAPRYEKKTRYLIGSMESLKSAIKGLNLSEVEGGFPTLEDEVPLVYVARVPLRKNDKYGYHFGGNEVVEKLDALTPGGNGVKAGYIYGIHSNIEGYPGPYPQTKRVIIKDEFWNIVPRGFNFRDANTDDLLELWEIQ